MAFTGNRSLIQTKNRSQSGSERALSTAASDSLTAGVLGCKSSAQALAGRDKTRSAVAM
jgi:hypothetical protein